MTATLNSPALARRLRLSVGAAALAALLVGCGNAASSSPSTSATHASKPGPTAAAICARVPTSAVAHLVARASSRPSAKLRRSASGTALLVQCKFSASGVNVGLSLDLAQDNAQRFDNRIVETTQFSNQNPGTLPQPVRGVGDARSGDEGAQWIPALHQLLAYRPGRYLIVDFTVRGASNAADRAGAADLARLAFPRVPSSKLAHRSHIPRAVGG